MPDEPLYASYPVFKSLPERLGENDREVVAKEVQALFDDWSGHVTIRGTYSTTGFTHAADLMFWWVGRSTDKLQDMSVAFKRTELGRALDQVHQFLGVTMPAEFARDHRPAFADGKDPKKYMTVYPFVRTPEWYLLPPEERGGLLRAHGEAGREYPDVSANTTSAFGLGDYEWILCFEADDPERLVQLIRRLRATEARRYTKLEIPFYTGIRKPIDVAVRDLP